MARIRSIKPSFFRHVSLFRAEREEALPLRLAFAGLWTAADREGRFEWEPEALKLDCLPYDEADFSRVLDALWTRGFIVKYAQDNKVLGYIPGWHKHQVINNRETASSLPEPNENNILTREPRVNHASATPHGNCQGEGKGREGEGKGTEVRADARAAELAFAGNVVRLNVKDFEQWRRSFSKLDLLAELTARDAWLASEEATDEDRRKWFISTSKYLANRNMLAGQKANDTSDDEIYRGVL